jgi:hypothetical protein
MVPLFAGEEEEAAMSTKLLFVRLITKGRQIIVCLFVG